MALMGSGSFSAERSFAGHHLVQDRPKAEKILSRSRRGLRFLEASQAIRILRETGGQHLDRYGPSFEPGVIAISAPLYPRGKGSPHRTNHVAN
jgi:hypothetical protein